ncbi:MAG: restriction endonuclease [Ignavibacteriaceae bacterium]|nr:restriction endonuclease [Ignavibacteriaceae bacterium]
MSEKERLLKKQKDDIDKSILALQNEENRVSKRVDHLNQTIEKFISEKIKSFPWLSALVADYVDVYDKKLEKYLETKSHPAQKAAEMVKDIRIEKRFLEQKSRELKYTLDYYESLFPILKEYANDGLEDLANSLADNRARTLFDVEYDPALEWLSSDEYKDLSQTDRYQRALDNYFRRNKSRWQIGKDYERYIGYTYEMQGYSVTYQGIKLRFEDLGIDLICQKPGEILLIQCKNWRQNRLIREASINQLFGTSVKFTLENFYSNDQIPLLFTELLSNFNVKPMLITSTKLSDVARNFANALGIIVKENVPYSKYPIIKCNINRQTGEKIYHLPFDQQYDNTIIEFDRSEYYVQTIAEAEELGFRRAYKWRGN